jgi:type VI secretion system protein ImpH
MPTPAWNHPANLMQRLIDQPQKFQYFQAVRVIDQWLRRTAPERRYGLEDMLRCRNSVSLQFPAGEIEAITFDADGTVQTADALQAALDKEQLRRIRLTPAFMGLLGVNGVLPYCYTETIAAQINFDKNEGGRAFLDSFSHRSMVLFYRGWEKCHIEYRRDQNGEDGLLPLQLALAGVWSRRQRSGQLPEEVIAHYASLIRHRPVSAAMLVGVLKEYFGLPFRLEPFVGGWVPHSQCNLARLGTANCELAVNTTLGPRYRRADLKLRLWIGPLSRREYDHFLPGAPGSKALRSLLGLFDLSNLCFQVRLILRSQHVAAAALDSAIGLGRGVALASRQVTLDNDDTFFEIAF